MRYLQAVYALPPLARRVAVVLLAALLLLLLLTISETMAWYAAADQRLSRAEPRIGRLLGYADSVELLRDNSEYINQRLAAFAYPADVDLASSSANAQQQVRRLIEAAGLRVSGSQVLGPSPHEGFEEIRIELSAYGAMEDLEQALLALPEARPLILVRSLEVSPSPKRRNESGQSVTVSLRVSVLRLQ